MRKLFTFFALLLGAISFVGCSSDDTPLGDTQPQISITQVAVTPDSFTFKVTTSEAGTLGYTVVAEGYETPKVDQWFTDNSKVVKKSETITISNLNADTNYTLYAIFRAKKSGNLSDPQKVEFTTPDDGINAPIVIHNATYDTINFSINLSGTYIFQCIDKPSLSYYGDITIEQYIELPGIGIVQKEPVDVEWVNGNYWGSIEMRVREDCDYYVVAANIDSEGNITGKIHYKEVRTPKRQAAAAGVEVELTEVTSTSVTIKTTPDSSVSMYYVLVNTKAWSDDIVANYGQSMLETLVEYPNSNRWELYKANEATWGGLLTATDYICHVLVKDSKGGKNLILVPFTTKVSSSLAPTADVSLTPATENGYCTLHLNILSEDAESATILYNTTLSINSERNGYNNDDSMLVNALGMSLSAEQMAAIKSTGLTFIIEDLFPGLEYTAIVSLKNDVLKETIKVVSCTTPEKPVPARVESDLFTSLLGEWEVSYDLYQFNDKNVQLNGAKVTIAQGADDDTADYYRSHNRLVVQGWPFNVEHDGTHNRIPYYSPADLKESSSTWLNYPALALRDYGPKIFLEIGEGDVITVPSSRGEYLYNWSTEGTFYFFGSDLDNGFTAPATFPVTLLDDGDTMVIGALASGEEFGYGIYRPSVFRNDLLDYRAVATGDIILKRVK